MRKGRPSRGRATSRRGVMSLERLEDRRLLATAAGLSGPVPGAEPPLPPHVPNQLLVQYRPGADAAGLDRVAGLAGSRVVEVIDTAAMRAAGAAPLQLIEVPAGVSLAAAVRQLKADPSVALAEPNWVYTHQVSSNDPYYTNGSLWGMYGSTTKPANAIGSQAGAAWAAGYTGSSSVYVGIIDEGFMTTHEDLAANVGVNPGEIAGNGRDDDGNGYVDDANSWDFAGNDNTVFDGTADDHGTHVAGTIGAVGGNGKGVAGVNWSVKLLSGKFLGANGGTTANAIKAVDYFTDLKRRGVNIVATNNSWGGGGFSQALKDAIDRAGAANILFVAAAGNGGSDGIGDNNDATPSYPASYTSANVIAVASITSSGARSSFSNYGATSVDIGAPGSGIYSTLPGRRNTSTYGSYSGTSMATPHVTGAVALYASANPTATAAQIRQAILATATPTAALAGKTVSGGRLNVAALMASGNPPPSGATITQATTTTTTTQTVPGSTTITRPRFRRLATGANGAIVAPPSEVGIPPILRRAIQSRARFARRWA